MKLRAIDVVSAVAVAELRFYARLARTRVFVALGAGVVLTAYGFYFAAHGYWSAPAPEMGYFSPRLHAAPINLYLLWIFLAAVAFLAIDICNRNHRERVADVVDSRPASNLAFLAGSLIGLVLVAWVPMLLVVLGVQLFGWVSRRVGFWFDEPVEPVAQAAFLLLDALPILCFWIALVFLLAVVLRNRLLVALVALAVLGLQMWAYTAVPASLYPAVSLLSAQVGWASDIVPRFADAATAVHRGGLILLAGALTCAAAVAHPRHDGRSKRGRSVVAAGLGACGLLAVSWVATERAGELNTRERWRAAHEYAAAAFPARPDIERISGDVSVMPGEQLGIDVKVTFARSPGLGSLLLSFNPGMRVERVDLGGQAAAFRHRDGLLEIELPESSTTEHGVTMSLRASGIPDSRFAYLHSAAEWLRRPPANQLRLLGTESALFDRRFVALMPGTAWLPIAGPNLEQAGGGADFFAVDLTVAAPRGWLVAGPGRREQIGREGAVSRVRFRPKVPIAEVGLVAGRFERFAATVADVEVELLLHRDHLRNALFFADAGDALVARIDELLSTAESFGIPYPLDTLSAVEVPSRLRGYRGSWRMETAMVLPGVLMLKEHGFPTASFEGPLNDDVLSRQDDLGEAMVGRLRVHTGKDVVSGTDVHRGLARNLFALTRASGPGADALNFVCEELTYRLVGDYNVPVANQFSAHRFDVDAYFGAVFGRAAQGLAVGHFGPLRLFYPYVDRPSTWSLAGATSLADLSHHEMPRLAEDALLLRGTSVARAMYDGLGRVGAGQLLAELRRRYAGGTFDAEEFAMVAASVGADLEFLGDWLGDHGWPGYMVAPRAQVHRLPDDEGAQRHQARVHVRNDEPVAGLVRFSTDRWGFVTRGWPFRIPAAASVEVGLVLPEAPNQLWLHPYGSLNRGSIRIDLADFDPVEIVDSEVLEGVRPSDWGPERGGLVIDDLDGGFTVIDDDGGARLRGLGSLLDEWEIDLDQGLPVMERQRGEWLRLQVPSAWGKYRRTVALSRPGHGDRQLAFVARLDSPGRWQLEYHVPNRHVPPPPGAPDTYASTLFGALGRMDMRLESSGVGTPIAFDAGAAEVGWNKVGEFDLEHRDARLVVSNRTDGETVVADAIRWRRVDGSPAR